MTSRGLASASLWVQLLLGWYLSHSTAQDLAADFVCNCPDTCVHANPAQTVTAETLGSCEFAVDSNRLECTVRSDQSLEFTLVLSQDADNDEQLEGRTVLYEVLCLPTLGTMDSNSANQTLWVYNVDPKELSDASGEESVEDVFTFR
eukprot:7808298-Pyramimonas_sp.AAC.1